MPSFASRTMQKLYSARLLLQHFELADQQDEFVRPAYVRTYTEAIVFQLQGAVQALLYEIADAARMPTGNWMTPCELAEAAESQGRVLPQLNQLQALEADSFSWLSQLNRRYQACWLPDTSAVDVAVPAADDRISLTQDSVSDRQQLELWLDSLQALAADLRQTMQEF